MPNKKVFKSLLISLFLLIAGGVKAFSFELFQFSVAPKYALHNGQLNEYVLYKNGNNLSELNWEIKNISLLGFNATMSWEMILLEAECMWGFPKASGNMLDSDWLNSSNYGMKTDYSESSNRVDYLGDLELRMGVNIKTWDFLYIIPYGCISYSKICFEAENGYGWYGDYKNSKDGLNHYWSDAEAKYLKSGTLCPVDFERETFNYGLGIKSSLLLFKRYTFSLDFCLAIFTQINSIDKHYTTMNKSSYNSYLDKMQGFFKSFTIRSEFDVKIWKGLSAGAGFKFVYINQTLGNDYSKTSTETKYSLDSTVNAAASGYSWNVEAFVRYSF